jgi:hypothetical protein
MKVKSLSAILLLLCFSIFSCISRKEIIKKQELTINQKHLIELFKGSTFRTCLRCGYYQSPEIKKILRSDRSYTGDFPLGLKNYQLLDSIAKNQLVKIIADSVKYNMGYYENLEEYGGMIGNYVIQNCLELYTSHYLDSIARQCILRDF